MSLLLQALINGLVSGALLAVPAIGFTAMFAVLRFPNFSVSGIATFKHAGTVPVVHLTNGTDYNMSFFSKPSSIQIVEAFRITPEGQIDLVEAVGASAAYGLDPHWPGGVSGK